MTAKTKKRARTAPGKTKPRKKMTPAEAHKARYPHGECECRNGCQCAGVPGPAYATVERNGKRIKVCTRCDFSSDKPTMKLLVTRNSPMRPFSDYDALGVMCIAFKLDEQSEKKKGKDHAAE